MEIVQLYRIAVPEERRILGYTRNALVASDIARGNGFWGADASITPETMRIFDSVEDFNAYRRNRAAKNEDNPN